jgi:hypothetical protein
MNVSNTQTLEPQALTCIGCGTAENVVNRADHHGEDLCPRCSKRRAMWDSAIPHLRSSLEQIMREWTAHWLEAGVSHLELQELAETTLEGIHADLHFTVPVAELQAHPEQA